MTKDYLLGGKEHGRYLEERFAARIFSEKDIERTIQAAVAAYLRHLDDVESQLLVNLEADLTDVSPGETPANIDRQAIEQVLAKAIQDAVQAAAADTRGMIGQELVSYIAGDVLAIAAIELADVVGHFECRSSLRHCHSRGRLGRGTDRRLPRLLGIRQVLRPDRRVDTATRQQTDGA